MLITVEATYGIKRQLILLFSIALYSSENSHIRKLLRVVMLRSSSFIKSKEATWIWRNIWKTKNWLQRIRQKRDWINNRNNRKCTNVVVRK